MSPSGKDRNSEMGLKRQIQLLEVIKSDKNNAEMTGASLHIRVQQA